METIEEIKTDELIINAEPEFVEGFSEKIQAQYFILCEDSDDSSLSKNAYECSVLSVPVLDWVKRACGARPIVLRVTGEDEIIQTIRPYLDSSEFSVVLYANTPLVVKQHIFDLLGFVQRKNMNVCKLKKGYVFRNEFIERADEFYSIDVYNFASNDFFEVNSLADLEFAKQQLKDRMFAFYSKNGVEFENKATSNIDATVQIDYSSKILSGASVLNGSKLGTGCVVKTNAVVKNSKLGEDVEVGENAILENIIAKNGVKIEAGAVLKDSVLGEDSVVSTGAKLIKTALESNAKVEEFCMLKNCKVETGAVVEAGNIFVSKTVKADENLG